MTSAKPLQHTAHWAEGCNKKAARDFYISQRMKVMRPRDHDEVYSAGQRAGEATACRKCKCMVEGLSEVDKLTGSLEVHYGGGGGGHMEYSDEDDYDDDDGDMY